MRNEAALFPVIELLQQPVLVGAVNEHVDACRNAPKLEVLAVEVSRVAVGVAGRGALLDGERTGAPLLAAAEKDRRAEAAHPRGGVTVVVGEAEASLPVTDDEAEVGRAAQLEPLEAEQVPVVVRRMRRVPEPARALVRPHTAVGQADELAARRAGRPPTSAHRGARRGRRRRCPWRTRSRAASPRSSGRRAHAGRNPAAARGGRARRGGVGGAL